VFKLYEDKLKDEAYVEEHVITHIDNPSGRIKFKDTRKLSIGVSKKDLLSYRCKKKSAFYNCFVLILRMKIADSFKEFHVKVFNKNFNPEYEKVLKDNLIPRFNKLKKSLL
jgi:hypothetical protein